MRPRTLALLIAVVAASTPVVAPGVGASAPGGDAAVTTATPERNATTSAERSDPPGTTTLDPAGGEFTRESSLQDNVLRFFLFPGAVLGLFVGVAHSLAHLVVLDGRRVVRELVRKLVGFGGGGLLAIAAVAMIGEPPSGRILLGGLGANCAAVALADRYGSTAVSKAGAAAGIAAVTLLVARAAAVVGAPPPVPPVIVAAPGVGAAGLFLVGMVAARRSFLSAAAVAVCCYWAGCVTAGLLTVDAVGMAGGLAIMFLTACCALGPLVGTPLYALGFTTSTTPDVEETAPNRD